MNLQSFQASPREMITFNRLLNSSMSYFPLVLCEISAKMLTITTSKFWLIKSMDANFFYYSINMIELHKDNYVRACIC